MFIFSQLEILSFRARFFLRLLFDTLLRLGGGKKKKGRIHSLGNTTWGIRNGERKGVIESSVRT